MGQVINIRFAEASPQIHRDTDIEAKIKTDLQNFHNQYHHKINQDDYTGYFIDKISHTINSKFSAHSESYDGPDSFREALARLEEYDANLRKESLRTQLLIATAGDPATIMSIYKNTAPSKNGSPQFDSGYLDAMGSAVGDAVRSQLSSMSLAELKRWAGLFPNQVGSLLLERETKILILSGLLEKHGVSSEMSTGRELDLLENQVELKSQQSNNQGDNFVAEKFTLKDGKFSAPEAGLTKVEIN